MHRGSGDRYRERNRSNEPPPVRRRSAYSPDHQSRSYRHKDDDGERRFRDHFHRRRDDRRYSRYSPPRRRRRSRSSSGSRSPSPRRSYRHSRGHFRGNRYSKDGGAEDSVDSQSHKVVDHAHGIPNSTPAAQSHTGQAVLERNNYPDLSGPTSTAPSYQNLPPIPDGRSNYPQQPFYYPLTAEQNHVPQFYPQPPPMRTEMFREPNQPVHDHKPKEHKEKGPPGIDEDVIRKILDNLKSKGVIDKFRKTFLEECDDKPDYITLSERVGRTVTSFLKARTWLPEINKNTERQLVRRRILESSYFVRELDEMLDRCFVEAESNFMPVIEECVYEYLGIEKPEKTEDQDEAENENESPAEEQNAETVENENVEEEDEDKEESEAEAEEEGSGSGSSGSSYMDVDSTEEESDSEIKVQQFSPRNLPPPPPISSYYPSHIPGIMPGFNRISHLVPNHPPPPPLPRPLGFGRHIPLLSNTIMKRNPVENPPLPPTDDEDENENPPPPSDSDSSTENEDNSDSEEISVGHASPKGVNSPTTLAPDIEPDDSQSSVRNTAEEVDQNSTVSSPPSLTENKTVPISPKSVKREVESENQPILVREPSESEESPQPPPPGEEDVPLPIFLNSRQAIVSESALQIPLPPENDPEPPLPESIPLPPPPETENVEEIPIPVTIEEDEEIPLPISESDGRANPVPMDFEEIPLPEDLEDGELETEIPLPETVSIQNENEVAQSSTVEVGAIPIPESTVETEDDSEEDDDEHGNYSPYSDGSYESLPSPLVHSRAIPLPPSPDIVPEIPVAADSTGNVVCQDDLSPVTSGDLDDISDDSLKEMPSPFAVVPLPAEEIEEGEIDLPEETEYKPVEEKPNVEVSSTSTVPIVEVSSTVKEEFHGSTKLEVSMEVAQIEAYPGQNVSEPPEMKIAELSPPASAFALLNEPPQFSSPVPQAEQSPVLNDTQSGISPEVTSVPETKTSPPSSPVIASTSTLPAHFQELPPSPSPLEIDEELPTVPGSSPMEIVEQATTLSPMPLQIVDEEVAAKPEVDQSSFPQKVEADEVFEEDDEWESPAFEKFGETSPPRIDKVEEESFENLIHTVSPQKKPLSATSKEKSSRDERSSKSSSSSHRRHHSSSKDRSKDHHRSKDSSSSHHRKSESSRSDRKHSSKSENSKDSKREESSSHHRHKSHKSSRSSHHSHSSSSKRKSEGEGSLESKEPRKDDKKKDSRRHSTDRKHDRPGDRHHSSSKSRKESSSGRKVEAKSSSSSSPIADSVSKSPEVVLKTEVLPNKTEAEDSSESGQTLKDAAEVINEILVNVEMDTLDAEVEEPTIMPLEIIEECDSGPSGLKFGTFVIGGERIEVLDYLEPIPTLEMKMRYYTKYLDPLLMDDDVSLDNFEFRNSN